MECRPTIAPNPPSQLCKVTETKGFPEKTRRTYYVAGLSPHIHYAVYNNSFAALKRAIFERVFYVKTSDGFAPPPVPAPNVFNSRMLDMFNLLRRNSKFCTPLTAKQFADSYVGPKHKIYSRAERSLEQKQFEKKDAFISSFTKCEKYIFSKHGVTTKEPVPRIIQPRGPRALVTYGRYIKPIEKKIYASVNNVFGSVTIFKGLNADLRGKHIKEKWDRFNKPVCVGLDASRFDQHVSAVALQWEHNVYKLYYPGDSFFQRILTLQIKNRCYARHPGGTLKYITDGCRMSGDMNTALGNCLLMSSMVYAYCKFKKVPIELANDGDDCVVIMESTDLDTFQDGLKEWFLDMGFNMTVEDPVYLLEKVVFCQSQPVYDGEKYIMVRDPRVAIAKDCLAIKPLDNPRIWESWCAAVGIGGMSLTGGIPVWNSFYARLLVCSNGAKPLDDPTLQTGLKLLAKGMRRKTSVPTPESRFSFYLAFDVYPSEQLAIEEYYDNVILDYGITQDQMSRTVNLPIR